MSTVEFQNKVVKQIDRLKVQALNLTNYNVEDANDLIQETMLKALLNKEKYREDKNFKSWLGVIMRHTFINAYRKKHLYKTKISATDRETMDLYADKARSNIASNIILKDVQDALDRLPEKNKIPIIRFYEGYSYDEISKEFQIPVSRVKSRIFSGRENLRKQLTEYRNREF